MFLVLEKQIYSLNKPLVQHNDADAELFAAASYAMLFVERNCELDLLHTVIQTAGAGPSELPAEEQPHVEDDWH